MNFFIYRAYRRLFGKTKADLVTQLDGMYRRDKFTHTVNFFRRCSDDIIAFDGNGLAFILTTLLFLIHTWCGF